MMNFFKQCISQVLFNMKTIDSFEINDEGPMQTLIVCHVSSLSLSVDSPLGYRFDQFVHYQTSYFSFGKFS